MPTFSTGNIRKGAPDHAQRSHPDSGGADIITGNTERTISHSNGKVHSSSTLKGRKYTENFKNAEFQLPEKGREMYF